MLNLENTSFHVVGALEFATLPGVLEALGARQEPGLHDRVQRVVVGSRRVKGRAAAVARVKKWIAAGAAIELVEEKVLVQQLLPLGTGEVLGEWRSGGAGLRRWNTLVRHFWRQLEPLDLTRVDLSHASLPNLGLHRANLSFARFSDADLAGACLTGVAGRHAEFAGARLPRAELLDVHLDWADLQGADLSGARLVGSAQGADWTRARLEGAVLRGNLSGGCFRDAVLRDADLRSCDLSEADFSGADLQNACFEGAGGAPSGPTRSSPPAPAIDLGLFLRMIDRHLDRGRLERSLEMLRAERFTLFTRVDPRSVAGVVRSQREPDLIYSCRLDHRGNFGCCPPIFEPCLGMQGTLCKHIILLVVGLVHAERLPSLSAYAWVRAARGQRPHLDLMNFGEPLALYQLSQKQAVVDWRPTETIPEDYYAL